MPWVDALSVHPIPTHAAGEVIGEVYEQGGAPPDLCVLFAGSAQVGALEDVVRAVNELLEPGTLVGATTGTVIARGREVEGAGALALLAGYGLGALTYHLAVRDGTIRGFPAKEELPADASALLVLAEPTSFPTDQLVTGLRDQAGIDLPVLGGVTAPGARLVRDHDLRHEGAVMTVLSGVDLQTVVSPGCRPIGDPMVVTAGDGTVVRELAGRRAMDRVQETIDALDDERSLVRRGLFAGIVVAESSSRYAPGDFLIRPVLGVDRQTGGIALDGSVEVGDVVQLHVRDPEVAATELRRLLRRSHGGDATLVFTGEDRPLPRPEALEDRLDGLPGAGMACGGEIGPVHGRSHLHSWSTVVAHLRERRGGPG